MQICRAVGTNSSCSVIILSLMTPTALPRNIFNCSVKETQVTKETHTSHSTENCIIPWRGGGELRLKPSGCPAGKAEAPDP